MIYGAGVTVPAARRWKTQINENAKAPAYFVAAPELLHNEVCGWAGAADADARSPPWCCPTAAATSACTGAWT